VRNSRVFIAVVIVASAVLTACSNNSNGSSSSETSYVAGDGSTILVAADKRGDAIELASKTLEGKPLDITNWRGDIVVVNLWASWCGPCRSEAVTLEKVNKQLAPKGIHFLGLNTRDGLAAAKAFEDRFPTGYPSIQDNDGVLTLAFGNLGPAATPSTMILDRQGRVAARILGPVTEAQLRDVTLAVAEGS
jgi:thiol-disulfide isomerase/thioredoxin